MSVIEEIFLEARGFHENIKLNEKYFEHIKKCADLSEKLNDNLSDEQKILLTNLIDEQGGLEYESNITHFAEGFKLGLAIAAESFLDK